MIRTIAFLVLLAGTNAFHPVNHVSCIFSDKSEEPTGRNFTIEVSDCINPNRCPLYRGTQHDIRFCFDCSEDSSSQIQMVVHGDFGAFLVPYGSPHSMCNTTYEWYDTADSAEIGNSTEVTDSAEITNSTEVTKSIEIANSTAVRTVGTCSSTGGLMSNRRYCFETKFDVKGWYPKLSLHVKFTAQDTAHAKNIACVKVPVEITDRVVD